MVAQQSDVLGFVKLDAAAPLQFPSPLIQVDTVPWNGWVERFKRPI
jgi:hypothetical protein